MHKGRTLTTYTVAALLFSTPGVKANICTANVSTNSPVKYSNSGYLANVTVAMSRGANLIVTNISDEELTVKVEFRYYDASTGILSNTVGPSIKGIFSASTNNPTGLGGASMPPNTMGRFNLASTTTNYNVSAKITWESDKCINSPLLAAAEQYYTTSGGALSAITVNGGKPF